MRLTRWATLIKLELGTKKISNTKIEINTVIVPASSSQLAPFYEITREGTTADGPTIVITTIGENLDYYGEEFSSVSVVTIGESFGFVTGGSPISKLPTGNYTYIGNASVINTAEDSAGIEDGTFTMTANFGWKAAQITGSTDTYFFSASDININSSTGKFSDDSGLIGIKDGFSIPANTIGFFAGNNAEGVHGLSHSDLEKDDGLVALFYGSR